MVRHLCLHGSVVEQCFLRYGIPVRSLVFSQFFPTDFPKVQVRALSHELGLPSTFQKLGRAGSYRTEPV
ncbi:hypothetical protein OUZ56_032997 [Daphnia magna]|uniref:Uncharacterized protein n=1 Tax=Daphnia magna TaxID=35525 RepID=A0ABR0BAB2_9CRUS|nr:hypothetical protein OUZ56_032997 [Daphnia magna]